MYVCVFVLPLALGFTLVINVHAISRFFYAVFCLLTYAPLLLRVLCRGVNSIKMITYTQNVMTIKYLSISIEHLMTITTLWSWLSRCFIYLLDEETKSQMEYFAPIFSRWQNQIPHFLINKMVLSIASLFDAKMDLCIWIMFFFYLRKQRNRPGCTVFYRYHHDQV